MKLQNYQEKNYKPVKNVVPYSQIIQRNHKILDDLETLRNNYDDKQLIEIYKYICKQYKLKPIM